MTINIEEVVPVFLEKEKIERSKLWNKRLSFHKGEKVQIIAPSGSGKTSLVHFLYGIRKDYNGSISYDGKNIHSFSVEDFASLRTKTVSIIFQDLRLFPVHTVLKNIEIKRTLAPLHSENRITQMAAALGIENKLNKPVNTCSYGEQQRIAIIRALQQPFDFLVMDEPFSHLDDNNRKIAAALIEEEVNIRNAGVILADLKGIDYFKTDRMVHL